MDSNERNALNTYLDEIGQESPLTPEKEQDLAACIQAGDRGALEQLTRANLKFVVAMARRFRDRGLAQSDLISEGNIGLMEAAGKFDGSRGNRFVAYAAPYVRKAMERAVEQQAGLYRVPRDIMRQKSRHEVQPASVDAPLSEGNKFTLLDILENKDAIHPDDDYNVQAMIEALESLVATLDEREQRVVRGFYGLGTGRISLAEIAEQMGIKRERARQIRDRALRKIARSTQNGALKIFIRK